MDASRDFFEQKNPTEAKTYLYHKLVIKLDLSIYIAASMIISIYVGLLFWNHMDTPSNFSFFLVLLQSSNMISDIVDTISLYLKSSDGR